MAHRVTPPQYFLKDRWVYGWRCPHCGQGAHGFLSAKDRTRDFGYHQMVTHTDPSWLLRTHNKSRHGA